MATTMTNKRVPPLAPYESGCEIVGCDDPDCRACGGAYGAPKPQKFTKQGVRDLNTKPAKHEHKLVPEIYETTIRIYGRLQTVERQRMVCYCGHVEYDANAEGAL